LQLLVGVEPKDVAAVVDDAMIVVVGVGVRAERDVDLRYSFGNGLIVLLSWRGLSWPKRECSIEAVFWL
jgi:hypothetical protein